ncbi:MAG TPA: DUF3455 domain-containing protein [Polyangiaceae bacterium]
MKHLAVMCVFCLLPACSSSTGGGSGSGENDASQDTGNGGNDSSTQDSSSSDSGGRDSAGDVEMGDASDGGCPGSWTVAPMAPVSIEVPADGGGVLLHAAGAGTQNYTCTAGADGGVSWVFVGPQANLADCNGNVIGQHFASDGGAGFPEWITTSDGTYVIGHKLAAYTPDGGSGSVPWLLLQAVGHGGGSGTLSQVAYIQRLDTDGGNAPGTGCDAGDMVQVPYTADYWFYGP